MHHPASMRAPNVRAASAGATKKHVLLAAMACAAVTSAHAQAWVPGGGHGSMWTSYEQKQSLQLGGLNGHVGVNVDFGQVIDRTWSLNLDYGLTDRWALSIGLPYESNRYRGDDPHDPRTLPFPNDQRFLDDGRFHGGWADPSVGLRFQWLTRPFLVTPFIAWSHPSHTYTFFAHSAIGGDQWAVQFGVYAGGWL